MSDTLTIRDPELMLREYIVRRLSDALPDVAVFDHVPASTDFPYVEIGDSSMVPWTTSTNGGVEIALSVDVLSSYHGPEDIIRTSAVIIEALTKELPDLSAAFFKASLVRFEARTTTKNPEEGYRVATVSFRWKIWDTNIAR